MKIFIVWQDDCNEEDCGCEIESIHSIWDEEHEDDAIKARNNTYHGRIETQYLNS